jgi:hypothetical protein
MTRHSDQTRLRHMLDHATEAVHLVHGKNRTDLDADRLLNLSLVRLLEIVGEAAARLSSETRSLYPQIPWPDFCWRTWLPEEGRYRLPATMTARMVDRLMSFEDLFDAVTSDGYAMAA